MGVRFDSLGVAGTPPIAVPWVVLPDPGGDELCVPAAEP